MNKLYIIAILLSLLFIRTQDLFSVPAKPSPITLQQTDGSELTVYLRGDESFHFYTSEDGHLLLPGDQDILYYAELPDNGELNLSSYRAHNVDSRSQAEQTFLNTLNKEKLYKALERKAILKQTSQRIQHEADTSYPTRGEQKALVILVQFTDKKFSIAEPTQAFNDMMNKEGYSSNKGTGSARDFYIQSSLGQYKPHFDVFGPITLSKKLNYYGGNTSSGQDVNAKYMVIEACQALDDKINFADYDHDNDGVVDNVYLFYAGYSESEGAPSYSIWPHSSKLYNASIILDGVKINKYACSSELRGTSGSNISGIGTFCHEFGHVLGLPDLYSTGYQPAFTPNSWSTMDNGSYNNGGRTPPYFSSYERYSLGWIEPAEITASDTTFVLPDISTNQALIIKTKKENEYFLLENRQKHDWDMYIPGHGMLVWHIDYYKDAWNSNTVNNIGSHQYVDIVEADGILSEETRDGDAFPGTKNVTSITNATYPNLRPWDNSPQFLYILNIKESEKGIISFQVIDTRIPDAPKALPASQITSSSFQANWEKVVNATSYELDVYTKDNKEISYVNGFLNKDVGNNLSLLLEGLQSETDYYYVVRAKAETYTSKSSEEMAAKTITTGGIDALVLENIYISIYESLITVRNTVPGDWTIQIYNILGELISTQTTRTEEITVNLTKGTIYIIKVNEQSFKIVL